MTLAELSDAIKATIADAKSAEHLLQTKIAAVSQARSSDVLDAALAEMKSAHTDWVVRRLAVLEATVAYLAVVCARLQAGGAK